MTDLAKQKKDFDAGVGALQHLLEFMMKNMGEYRERLIKRLLERGDNPARLPITMAMTHPRSQGAFSSTYLQQLNPGGALDQRIRSKEKGLELNDHLEAQQSAEQQQRAASDATPPTPPKSALQRRK